MVLRRTHSNFIFSIIVLFIFSSILEAQSRRDFPLNDSLKAPTTVVGTIAGSGSVGGLGGAVYNIPIQVPEGLGGLQPSLSIAYNSQGGNDQKSHPGGKENNCDKDNHDQGGNRDKNRCGGKKGDRGQENRCGETSRHRKIIRKFPRRKSFVEQRLVKNGRKRGRFLLQGG